MKHLASPVKFREDINGLRAWAVLGVLFFHFELIGLPGGFAGVDMFFVISGYLMTAIITSGLEKENFSFLKFYMSRVRRILPALIVVLFLLLILGWFYLPNIDYNVLGTQSISALGFISNIYYYMYTGYFDVSAHEKWLLHTWSLAVEAQFYIIYPIILFILWKIKPSVKTIMIGIIILFILSISLNIYFSYKDSSASFYLLPMRAWELISGGIVFLLIRKNYLIKKYKNIAFYLGWMLIIFSLIFIDKHFIWPSYWAVIPVLGVSLVLLANNQTSILTDNFIFQWIGDRSYSLYLWHWPLVVGLYFVGFHNSWFYVVLALFISIFLSHLSYKYIEVPTRKILSKSNLLKEIIIISIVTMFLGGLSYVVKKSNFNNRLPIEVEIAANGQKDYNPRRNECLGSSNKSKVKECIYGEDKINAILIGDSHSDSVATSLFKASNSSIIQLSLRGCPVLKDAKISPWVNNFEYKACMTLLDDFKDIVKKDKNLGTVPVIYVTRASEYIFYKKENNIMKPMIYFEKEPVLNSESEEFKEKFTSSYLDTICKLQESRQVYLVRPIPEMNIDVPRVLSRNIMFNKKDQQIKIKREDYFKRNAFIFDIQDKAVKKCNAKILDPIPYLCDDIYCYGSKDEKSLYIDDDHLSEYGNSLIVPMFEEIFKGNK